MSIRNARNGLVMVFALSMVCMALYRRTSAAPARDEMQMLTTVEAEAHGALRLRVTNKGTKPISAFARTAKRQWNGVTDTSVRYFDSALNSRKSPVGPSSAYEFELFGQRPLPTEAAVKAVIFADGTTWGDPLWLQRLFIRRQASFREAAVCANMLETFMNAHRIPESLRERLKSAEQAAMKTAGTTEEKLVIDEIYGDTLLTLQMDPVNTDGSFGGNGLDLARAKLHDRMTRLRNALPNIQALPVVGPDPRMPSQ